MCGLLLEPYCRGRGRALRAEPRKGRGEGPCEAEAHRRISSFAGAESVLEDALEGPRIILVARDFAPETSATCLWLRSFDVDVRCVRLTPYQTDDEGSLLISSEVIIPVPEAAQYMIRRERKEAASAGGRASGFGEEFGLDYHRERCGDSVRTAFDQVIAAIEGFDGLERHTPRSNIRYEIPRQEKGFVFLKVLPQNRFAVHFRSKTPIELAGAKSGVMGGTGAIHHELLVDGEADVARLVEAIEKAAAQWGLRASDRAR